MRVSIFLVLIALFCSCDSRNKNSTKIGGQIISPLSDKITLLKDGKVIDSIFLSPNGKFKYEFDLTDEGVFFFRHQQETQMLYLKPGDSLVMRINTVEFDESLTFGGDSSKENNFLIDHFLENEKNNQLILSYYKIDPSEFITKSDSILNERLKSLEKLEQQENLTPLFKDIAFKTISVEYFDMRERYAFLIRKYFPEKATLINDSYFAYRTKVDFDDKSMMNHFGYLRFLDNYFKNQSTMDCPPITEDRYCWNLNSYHNLKKRITLVLDKLDDEVLKFRFFNRFISREIILATTEEDIKDALEVAKSLNFTEDKREYLTRLANFQTTFLVNKNIGHLKLHDLNGESVQINEVLQGKPSVIHVWSSNSPNFYNARFSQIKDLEKKYPEVNFIGINIDFQNPNAWKKVVSNLELNSNQFQVIGQDHNKDLYANYLNKVLFIDADATVKQGEMLLNSISIKSMLVEFLNTSI